MDTRKERFCERCDGSMGYMSDAAYLDCDCCIEGEEARA